MKLEQKKRLQEYAMEQEGDGLTKSIVKATYDTELRSRLEKRLKDEYGVDKSINNITKNKYGIIAALCAIILVISAYFLFKPFSDNVDQDGLILAHLETPYSTQGLITRGSVITKDLGASRNAAALAYADRNYSQAAAHLTIIDSSDGAGEEDLFYLGLCYLYQDPPKASEAVAALEKAQKKESVYAEEIQWYLFLAYLLNQQSSSALEYMESILKENADHYRKNDMLKLSSAARE